MWRAADYQEGGDRSNGQRRDPVRYIKRPSIGGAQGPEEVFFLDKSPGSNGKLDVRRPTPDGGDNGKC